MEYSKGTSHTMMAIHTLWSQGFAAGSEPSTVAVVEVVVVVVVILKWLLRDTRARNIGQKGVTPCTIATGRSTLPCGLCVNQTANKCCARTKSAARSCLLLVMMMPSGFYPHLFFFHIH